MKDMGEAKRFVGIEITRLPGGGLSGIVLSQKAYIQEVVRIFGLDNDGDDDIPRKPRYRRGCGPQRAKKAHANLPYSHGPHGGGLRPTHRRHSTISVHHRLDSSSGSPNCTTNRKAHDQARNLTRARRQHLTAKTTKSSNLVGWVRCQDLELKPQFGTIPKVS